MDEENKISYYSVIPATVLFCEELKPNEKYQYYTLFLVDDKKYELFDENDNKIQNITGKDLEEHVLEKKKEIDKLYSY